MRRAGVVAWSGLVLFCGFLLPLLNSRPAPQAQAAPASEQSGTFFISCSTSGGAGIDTYFTGVFQTELKWKTLKGPGSGAFFVNGKTIDPASVQAILDHFYAYLTQKGDKFKPGSNMACDIKETEAEAQAAMQKRAYGGNPCSTCGKVVETGWKDQ
jgi:hypothetical protein